MLKYLIAGLLLLLIGCSDSPVSSGQTDDSTDLKSIEFSKSDCTEPTDLELSGGFMCDVFSSPPSYVSCIAVRDNSYDRSETALTRIIDGVLYVYSERLFTKISCIYIE